MTWETRNLRMEELCRPPDMPTVDKRSFVAGIVTQYGRRLRRFLSVRLRNVQDVPELAQEVLLRLLRQSGSGRLDPCTRGTAAYLQLHSLSPSSA